MNTEKTIEQFYQAFANGNVEEMVKQYHDDVVFEDPAFGRLEDGRAIQMWKMLLSNKAAAPKVSFENIVIQEDGSGSVNWTAEYFFGPKKRKVINKVKARFVFKEGKIIEHTDTFDLWAWSRQAIGPVGYLLGWSSFFRKTIQKTTNQKLDQFIGK